MSKTVWYGEEFKEKLNYQLQVALDKTGDLILSTARDIVPVDTGALQRDIKKDRSELNENKIHVGNDLDYSLFIEVGTVKMPAQPYLRPALYNNWQEIKNFFKNLL